GTDPQPGAGLRGAARGDADARPDLADQVAGAAPGRRRGQRERGRIPRLRNPRAEEVVLQEGDPAAGDRLVERAIVDEVIVRTALVLVGGAVPRRALEAVALRAHRSLGLERARHPRQLAVDEALPRLRAA